MRYGKTLAAWLLCSACALASAQDPGATEAGAAPGAALSKGEIKAMRDFKLLDFNSDGQISRSEVALFPRLAAAFSAADTNHNNFLSYEEVRAYAVRYRAERERQRAQTATPAAAQAANEAREAREDSTQKP